MTLTYYPELFDARTTEEAREIILTGEGSTTDERWRNETAFICNLIAETIPLTASSVVVDYGCGIGRLAKELISRHGCRVIGVDISAAMRAMAVDYVKSERFAAIAPDMLDGLIASGFAADAAIAVWVLQHCLTPGDDIARLDSALRAGGRLFVLNNIHRAIPTREKAWVNDGIDIKATLDAHFDVVRAGKPPEEVTPRDLKDIIFWSFYARKPA
jgi:cyclopropane fatty-acyl-phospholipid synthase-like methyltransferase